MTSTTASLIDDLVSATFGDRTAREQFLFRQSLHNLVRLARAEQLLEIRTSVTTLTDDIPPAGKCRKANVDGM